ncbi:MAG TPA: low molecular weight protein-tyrosine-phosphatase [Flavobacterium sp.]|uniref:low molecular weight protein-tyrosine-phosphatase n=1 Tax=unclassified Flavobacterium TaxID=196869 RepID=UPI000E920B29|nr:MULTISPECIES: low molecular weight protein-tyrosine-phosphatase [unclassified Flavobacterium]HBI01795.1 protein-tyrosine-phosphatase [Flavobacterium sp.]HRE77304.1 low molecular weight protein-tyrosine-phosphatase [Flavobacterium sp.]
MPVKILMVCLGNICRSPLAEGILASKLPKNDFLVDSAGTGHWHVGNPPDKRSILTAEKNGIDITNQRGKLFKPSFFQEYDYIYVMDTNNYADVIKMAKNENEKKKVQLILDELFPGENVDVPDPYNGIQSNFDQVFEMLEEACESIANKLLEKK